MLVGALFFTKRATINAIAATCAVMCGIVLFWIAHETTQPWILYSVGVLSFVTATYFLLDIVVEKMSK